jgi:polyisoprenoid-binding protein YceI
MNKVAIFLSFLLLAGSAMSQRYITKNGHIKFYSETPVETIEAHNNQVNSALDSGSGEFVFKVLMKSFEFEKALMQEHFNENYVESDKFPNATFKGRVMNITEIDFATKGEYKARVEGDLTIHGVTNKINEEGTFIVDGDKVAGKSVFIIRPSDYQIKIPKTVINNIAEEIEVTVDLSLEAFGN